MAEHFPKYILNILLAENVDVLEYIFFYYNWKKQIHSPIINHNENAICLDQEGCKWAWIPFLRSSVCDPWLNLQSTTISYNILLFLEKQLIFTEIQYKHVTELSSFFLLFCIYAL